MPVNPSTNRHPFDDLTKFRAYGSAAVTADAGSSPIALDYAPAYWDGRIATPMDFAVVIDVEAGTFSSHSYVAQVQVDDATDFSGNTVIAQVTLTATGQVVINIARESIPATARYIRVYMDVTGATPSITYAAWMAPIPKVGG